MEDLSMPIKVCHITTVHTSSDVRIFHKECKTLAEEGYEVYLIAPHDNEEEIDGVHIIPLPQKSGRLYRFIFKRGIALKKAKEVNAQIYHFHDPEMIFLGLKLKLLGKKVIYDVHEDVPAQILNKDWLGSLFMRKVISKLFNFLEKFACRHFDGVVTVTKDIVDKFYMNKRTTLLRNLPSIVIIDESKRLEVKREKFTMLYAGGLTEIRGIRELIEATNYLNGEVELLIFGKWDDPKYKKECEGLEGWKYTQFMGFKPVEEVYSYMKSVDLGLCTLYPTLNHIKSSPVKAFEYMACGIPILMSNFPCWMDVFEKSAIFVNPKNPKEMAEKIEDLVKNIENTRQIGLNNRKLVETMFSWEAEKVNLINLYKEILKDNSKSK
jgi:glycosyltransferase involved in cell wall biosynthesis